MSKSKHVFYGYYPSEDAREIFYTEPISKMRTKQVCITGNNLTTEMVIGCKDVRYRITVEKAPLQRKPKRRMK